MITHVISRNCRLVYSGNDYARAANAWSKAKADCTPGDVCRWDHESTERGDFAPDPHCGMVTVPAIYSGAMLLHPQKYVLTVAQYERTRSGGTRGMCSPKLGAV